MRRTSNLATNLKIIIVLFLLGVWADGNMGLKHHDAFASNSTRTSAIDGISITPDNQILVELMPEDTAPANLFDLNGRTLVFTPDGQGGYSRQVQALAWEEDIGETVADGEDVQLASFRFDFAGRRWGSFHVSRRGLLTFGGSFTFSYPNPEEATMNAIAGGFVTTPTISPLYNPIHGGTQHVAQWPDRVVITWITTEPMFYVHGVPPARPNRFQAILSADGSIRFNYSDVALGDGIVGLFPDEEVTQGALIARLSDARDSDLPGHLDLLEAAIYETNTDSMVILEFTVRGALPEPDAGTWYSYRLYFDTDRPWWDTSIDDLDNVWQIDIGRTEGARTLGGRGVVSLLESDASNRIALLADTRELQGIPVSVMAASAEFRNDISVRGNSVRPPTQIALPASTARVDLSSPTGSYSQNHKEVFHYRSIPDLEETACRVIDSYGDRFDLFVFHSEFRVDLPQDEAGMDWTRYGGNVGVQGAGDLGEGGALCSEGRLKGRWTFPLWIEHFNVINYRGNPGDRTRFDGGLNLFAHEFAHVWTAYASYERNRKRRPLFDQSRAHWRLDLHAPAAFPWNETLAGPGSLVGGRFWHENGDGTFTPIGDPWGGGPSWLDLYLMGLADASEVPDMFILRNLKALTSGNGEDGYWGGVFTGDKESISIEQIIAAEGPRKPSAARSQKDFNAGFVYLLEPGKTPTADLLDLHAEYRDKVQEHWFHITGERSLITTNVDDTADATMENPRSGSFQSGVAAISGWACDAQEIVIELNGIPYRAGYPTTRPDTQRVCGDTDNGFSLLWNWNNLGPGTHTVRALIDGVEFANTTVRVTTFGEQVLRGVSGTFPLSDFPHAGDTTWVQWAESLQNFVITDGSAPGGGGHASVAGVNARLENPSLGSAQSGIAAISGWACEAQEIVIELNGVPYRAGYPTTRPDTQGVCGDSDNGFSLLWNWNNLGPGTHTVRALLDGVEFANTTVRVTTFGVPFRQGLSGTFPIPDFPRSGENKRLQWEESLQNFVIIP